MNAIRILLLILIALPTYANLIPPERLMSWSYTGVRGGIPTGITNWCDVTVNIPGTNILATGDGTAQDYIAIQTALTLCPSNSAVLCPGNFRLTNTLTISKSGVVLRGAGQTNTKFLFDHGTPSGKIGIQTMDNGGVAATYNWTNGFTQGSSNLILTSVSGISTGTLVIVASSNTIAYGSTPDAWPVPLATGSTNNAGTVETYLGYPLGTGTHSLGHHAIVEGISGTTITVWPPLPIDYNGTNALVFRMGTPGYRIGLEDFTVDRYETNSNAGDHIVMYRCVDSWIKNVTSTNASSIHMRVNKSLYCTVQGCYVVGVDNYTSNAGYGIETKLYTTRCRFQDNIGERCMNFFHMSECSSQNVIAFNFSTNMAGPNAQSRMALEIGANHGAHPCMNLYEGNKSDKFYADFVHGTSSHGVALRNWFRGWGTNNAHLSLTLTNYQNAVHGVVLEAGARYYSFVGNIIGWTNKDPAISWSSTTYEVTNPATSIVFQTPANWVIGRWNADQTTSTLWDSASYTTLIRSNNFVATGTNTYWTTHTNEWTSASITNSYHLTEKPSWWGTWSWPAIGPDLTNALNVIPAEARRMGLTAPPPPPPAEAAAAANDTCRCSGRQ